MPVEEALRRVLASARAPLGGGMVRARPTRSAARSPRDVAALRTQPPFANSAMDGYALRAADAAGAGATLRVDRRIGRRARICRAASAPASACASLPARRSPTGADAVAVQEDADARRRRA